MLFSGVGWNPIPLIESEINDDDMLNKVCGLELLLYAALSYSIECEINDDDMLNICIE